MTTILIVEDEKEIRRFVRLALESEGLKIVEAEQLQRGLIEAATRKPDLVILDLGLPDGDGNDFIREVSDQAVWYWRAAGPRARGVTSPSKQPA